MAALVAKALYATAMVAVVRASAMVVVAMAEVAVAELCSTGMVVEDTEVPQDQRGMEVVRAVAALVAKALYAAEAKAEGAWAEALLETVGLVWLTGLQGGGGLCDGADVAILTRLGRARGASIGGEGGVDGAHTGSARGIEHTVPPCGTTVVRGWYT